MLHILIVQPTSDLELLSLLSFTLLNKHVILLHYSDVSDCLFAINRVVHVRYKLSMLLSSEWVDLLYVPTVTPLHPDQYLICTGTLLSPRSSSSVICC